MAVVRELEAARRERSVGLARLCDDCGSTHRGHVKCPLVDHWLIARTHRENPYPAHLLNRRI